jgi:hypothetical protein
MTSFEMNRPAAKIALRYQSTHLHHLESELVLWPTVILTLDLQPVDQRFRLIGRDQKVFPGKHGRIRGTVWQANNGSVAVVI